MTESFEMERLESLIADKRSYYRKLESDFARKKLQAEILFLQNELMPIVARETTILYSELTRYFERSVMKAVKGGCDALLLFTPLTDKMDETCKVGIVSPKAQKFGNDAVENIELWVDSIGVGKRKVNIFNFDIDE